VRRRSGEDGDRDLGCCPLAFIRRSGCGGKFIAAILTRRMESGDNNTGRAIDQIVSFGLMSPLSKESKMRIRLETSTILVRDRFRNRGSIFCERSKREQRILDTMSIRLWLSPHKLDSVMSFVITGDVIFSVCDTVSNPGAPLHKFQTIKSSFDPKVRTEKSPSGGIYGW
jgi:hypothetical protein